MRRFALSFAILDEIIRAMLKTLGMAYTKLIVWLWSLRPSLQLLAIRRFQAIEADGVWQLYKALEASQSSKSRAVLFQHLLEEERHAEIFTEVYDELSTEPFKALEFHRKAVLDSTSSFQQILLYVHVGEVDATSRFLMLSQQLKEGPLKRALLKICQDEAGHISLTSDLVKKTGLDLRTIEQTLFKIRWNRKTDSLKQILLQAMDYFGRGLLVWGYWFFGWMGAKAARKKFGQNFVQFDNNSLKRFNS